MKTPSSLGLSSLKRSSSLIIQYRDYLASGTSILLYFIEFPNNNLDSSKYKFF